jgi:hypothetical protein
MMTPPPVSGESYPNAVGSEIRSNYLDANLTLDTAYDDNVPGLVSSKPVSDVVYSINSTIELDQTTPRQHRTFRYSPGFSFYQPTSTLNAIDQGATLYYQFHLNPHLTTSARDFFQKSSNVFSQPYALSGGAASGAGLSPAATAVAPFAEQLSNTASADINYQFSENGMIGATGTSTILNFPNPAEANGLYNSDSRGGSAFYNRRLSSSQYIGVTYRYLQSLAYPLNAQSETQTDTGTFFYTIYLGRAFSMSLSGGPQYAVMSESSFPTVHLWAPAAMASVGWQTAHTAFTANYARAVTGGGGLLGAFQSNSASASARWQIARAWTVGCAASYAINKTVTPLLSSSNSGGYAIAGDATVEHPISDHIKAELGYSRLHQSYSSIAVISNAPDSNREYISISYQFNRPLGR